MASQIGGAIAPLLVVPIQIRYGWRASFYVFGAIGVIWSAVWYAWFRDSPAEKAGREPRRSSRRSVRAHPAHGHGFPWRWPSVPRPCWRCSATAFCYVYVYKFFQTWFHTFLVKGRGFTRRQSLAVGAAVRRRSVREPRRRRNERRAGAAAGPKWGRRSIGIAGLGSACLFTIAAMITRHQLLTVVLLSLVYGAITFQQSGVFGVCLDIGRKHAGSMVGLMNTAAQAGGLLGSVAYGYIVERFDSYDAPFVPMAGLLFLGALLWFRIDASKEIGDEPLVVTALPATAV